MKTSQKPSAKTKAKSTAQAIPDDMRGIIPHLVCKDAAKAIDFYKKAFGAVEMTRLADPKGRLMHAAIRIGDATVMLNDEFPAMGALSPKSHGGTAVTLHFYAKDVDAAFAKAVKAGATPRMPPADMFWGDRYGVLEDPFGHSWSIATHLRDMTPKEIAAAAKDACGG
jgi:uncharacterized glyoxalase superfamily protein PhnB